MFHEFIPFFGRIKPTTKIHALHSLSPSPLQTTEAPPTISDSIKAKPITTSSSAQSKYDFINPKLKKLYKIYQADLEKPVYIIRGTRDKALYGLTVVLTIVAVVINIYDINKPK